MKQSTPESLIPESENLIQIPKPSTDGSNGDYTYRLNEISSVKKNLGIERDRRALLYKKY